MLATFDTHIFWEALTSRPYWHGALLALELTLVSLAAACVIGFFLALGRSSRFRGVRSFVFFYSWIFRATPTLLQLLFIWNALPQLWGAFAGTWFKPFLAAYIGLLIFVLAGTVLLQFIRIPNPTAAERAASGRPLLEIAAQPRFIVAVLCAALGRLRWNACLLC